jgi:hypothetical protein
MRVAWAEPVWPSVEIHGCGLLSLPPHPDTTTEDQLLPACSGFLLGIELDGRRSADHQHPISRSPCQDGWRPSAVGYAFLSNGSRAFCPGTGPAADSCVSLHLHPSPFVFAALAFVVLVAIGRVLRRAGTEADAIRILDRAALVGTAIAGVSLLVSVVWFGLIPLESWNGGGTFFFPFPFGSVDLTVTPAS